MRIFNNASTRDKRKNLRKNQTEAEQALWRRLRSKTFCDCKFFRQYGIGEYIVDFYCAECKLVIELDGGQHYSEAGTEYDRLRENYMSAMGIKTIRFSNTDILQNIDGVLAQIEQELKTNFPRPPLC